MSIFDKMLRIAGRGPDGLAKAIKMDMDGNVLTTVKGIVANPTLDTPLNWKYTTAVTTAYAMFVPEHDGTVWGRNAGTGIYNIVDLVGSVVNSTPSMTYLGEIIHIHPYKEDDNQRIAFVTRDLANNMVRAYLANSMTDANPTLALEYVGGITDALSCDSFTDGIVNVILIGQYGPGTNPKNLWASFDGGRTYSVINQTTVLGTEMQSHWHAVHYDRFSGRIWASEGDGPNSCLNWSDDLGITWYRDTTHQPTLIKSFAGCVVFGHDDGAEYAGLSIWRRNNRTNRDTVTIERVLTINTALAPAFYPTAKMWAQRGNTAYVLFIDTESGNDQQYIYSTNDGGYTWTGAYMSKTSTAKIDYISGITKQGNIVGRLRKSSNPAWGEFKIVYAKVANPKYDGNEVVDNNKVLTLTKLEAITDTNDHIYSLSNILSEPEIRRIKEIKFSIYDTHTNGSNASATVSLYTSVYALNNTFLSSITGLLYTEIGALPDGITSIILSALAGGTGASAGQKVVPALKGLHSNLTIKIKFANTPTSGSITIKAELVV